MGADTSQSLPRQLTSDGEPATHTLVIELPVRLVDSQLLDGTLIQDAINGVLSIARVSARCGGAQVELNEIPTTEVAR